jgi:hypothetical protein
VIGEHAGLAGARAPVALAIHAMHLVAIGERLARCELAQPTFCSST